MTAASRLRGPAVVIWALLAVPLAACTAGSPPTTPPSSGSASAPSPAASTQPTRSTSRPPLPNSPSPSVLPGSPPVQLAPVSSSPDDLGRIDIRNGSPRSKQVAVRLPAAAGFTVTAGCTGRAGALLHYSVVGTSEPNSGFLFGSTTPCNGRFVTDAALANIDARTPGRLEVTVDAGVEDATVVLRPAPTDEHVDR